MGGDNWAQGVTEMYIEIMNRKRKDKTQSDRYGSITNVTIVDYKENKKIV
jgi:hypothetical protein